MRQLRLTLHYPPRLRHPMQAFIADCDAVERSLLLSWSGPYDGVETLLFRVEGDRKPYLAALDAVDSVLSYEVSSAGDDAFYVYAHDEAREPHQKIRTAFRGMGVLPIPPIEIGSDGKMCLTVVGDSDALRVVLDGIPNEIRVDVDAVGAQAGSLALVENTLTTRQREALFAAIELGYYDVPRTASVKDVAEQLGCASSTASIHLRKGESRLITTILDR